MWLLGRQQDLRTLQTTRQRLVQPLQQKKTSLRACLRDLYRQASDLSFSVEVQSEEKEVAPNGKDKQKKGESVLVDYWLFCIVRASYEEEWKQLQRNTMREYS